MFVQKQQTLEQTHKRRKKKELLPSKTKAKKQKISERENNNERHMEHAFLSVGGEEKGHQFMVVIIHFWQWRQDNY